MVGNVISFEQDISTLAMELPRLPDELDHVILETTGKKKLELKIRIDKVVTALEWLKANNEFYKDIVICPKRKAFYEERNGTCDVPTMKYAYEKADERIENEIPINEKELVQEDQLNGDWPALNSLVGSRIESETNDNLTKKVIQDKGNVKGQEGTGETHFAYPSTSKNPVSEYMPGFYSMAYPCLFPTGAGDYNPKVPLPGKHPRFNDWVCHLLNQRDPRFMKNPTFLYKCPGFMI